MSRAYGILLFVVALASPRALPGQSPTELLARGVNAYQALDYELAAPLLRRSLIRDSVNGAPLPSDQRARALSYLAATELFRGHRDAAVTAFRSLVQLDPAYRPDDLVFPPKVTNLYQEVRRDTRSFSVEAPPVTRIHGRLAPFSARLITSSLADVSVTLEREDGTRIRTLYAGPIADSMTVLWDGLASDGALPTDGRYRLRVAPRAPDGRGPRVLTVPLEIRRLSTDTVPWPEQPDLLPERTPPANALRVLGAGLVTGGVAYLLPAIVARGATASSARVMMGVGLGASGIAAFVLRRPGRPILANVDANNAKRAAWQEHMAGVRSENADRRSGARLEIRAGPVSVAVHEDGP